MSKEVRAEVDGICMQLSRHGRPSEVLIALRGSGCPVGWLDHVGSELQSAGYRMQGTFDDPAAIQRVEVGGLAAAVLFAQGTALAGLSLLRIIRSIDARLPCWLVTDDPTPQTLQTALALRVQSVMTHPVEATVLSGTVTRGLEQLVSW